MFFVFYIKIKLLRIKVSAALQMMNIIMEMCYWIWKCINKSKSIMNRSRISCENLLRDTFSFWLHLVFIAVWVLFLSCDTQGLLSLQPTGFSNWLRGLVALRHVLLHGTWDLSSLTRNRIHVPWIRRWILTIRPPEKSHKIHFCNNFFVFINLHFFLFHFVFVKLISCFPFRFWPLRK